MSFDINFYRNWKGARNKKKKTEKLSEIKLI